MKNKLFLRSIMLVLALVLVLGISVWAAPAVSAETSGDWEYSIDGGTATITGYTGTSSNVTVPKTFGSYTVTAIGKNALKGNTVIKTLSFPDALMTIGDYAFADCVTLEEVTLPTRLANLGNYSFRNCTSLKKIVVNSTAIKDKDNYQDEPFYNAGSATDGIELIFAEGCTRVPSYLFFPDSGEGTAANLKSVTFANSVTSIGQSAFESCPTLTTLNFGTGLTKIENYAFYKCTGLKTFKLPAAVTSIGKGAFQKSGLTGFTLSDSLTTIGEYAFADCISLTEVTLPKKLTSLGNYSFSNCTALGKITINSAAINDKDNYQDEPFYNAGSATDGVEVIFADGCTRVPSYLFFPDSGASTAANLKTVTFADSVTSIGQSAFETCPTLNTLNFGTGLTTIDSYAFYNCTGLKTVKLPAAVTSVGKGAFQKSGLTGFTLSDSLTTIGEYAFADCTSLTEVTLPKKLTNLGNYSFSNCTALGKITINSAAIRDKDNYQDEPFYNAGSATDGIEVIFADGCTRVPSYLFFADSGASTAANLKTVTFADSVTSIGQSAFETCPTLNTLNFGTGLTTIDSYAFYNCTGLKTVKLPAAVTSVGKGAFQKSGLTSITLSDSLTTIGENAFEDCIGLTSITLPGKLTNLGNYAFKNCTSLETITINSATINNKDDYQDEPFYNVGSATDGVTVTFAEGCTRVPSNLFYAYGGASTAANLKKVVFSNTVTSIGDSAFEGCTELNEVTIGKGVTKIEPEAFKNCGGLKKITIGKNVTEMDKNIFAGCENTVTIYGYTDTAAHTYATDYSIKFVALDEPKPTEPKPTEPKPTEPKPTEPKPTEPKPTEPESQFKDVSKDEWYSEEVEWAVDEGITTGISDTTFSPNETCTRAQVVTFLWRADGEPEPTSTKNPFKDVKKTDYFYKAVLWAVEKGITKGVDETHFAPNDPCTRGQVVTFLYRAGGQPKPESTKNPFKDVKSDAYYFNPVMWAVSRNITTGMDATHFAPDTPCNRAQIVTFLFRNLTGGR